MAPDGRSFITAVGLTQSSIWLHDGSGDRQISLEGYAFDAQIHPRWEAAALPGAKRGFQRIVGGGTRFRTQ